MLRNCLSGLELIGTSLPACLPASLPTGFRSVATNQDPRLERSCLERVDSESFWRSNSGGHRAQAEVHSARPLSGEVNFGDFASVEFWGSRLHLARAGSSGLRFRSLLEFA